VKASAILAHSEAPAVDLHQKVADPYSVAAAETAAGVEMAPRVIEGSHDSDPEQRAQQRAINPLELGGRCLAG
jgi:hypothetical protein